MTSRLGAIDIGTNSVRLLVADVDGAGETAALEPLDRRVHITRLGQGVDESRRLNPEAISRTLDVLREYRGALDELAVERARATATSAARDASNREDFFGPAADVLHFEPELLPGTEEARLSFLGATAGLDERAPYLTLDIGGGSTEFVVGTHEPEGLISVDTGSVRITEQYLHSDPPQPEELSEAVSVVRAHLADVEQEIPAVREAATLIGLAGTDHHGRRRRARPRRVRPRQDPSLPPQPVGRGRGVPHVGDGTRRAAPAQPGTRARPGRRDRRRHADPRDDDADLRLQRGPRVGSGHSGRARSKHRDAITRSKHRHARNRPRNPSLRVPTRRRYE